MQKDDFEITPFPDLSGFHIDAASQRGLRVCIVTEEIFGPVRNGGISSTYMYLAKMLAKAGYDVSVLYLKGHASEDHSIEHWIDWYAEDGVTLVPLPNPGWNYSGAMWQVRHYAAYHWLKSQPDFDIIHTSEWRGGCYYALLAKRQGLAFQNTIFLVKTSSPHVWNRHYQMQFLADAQAFKVMYPEQMCVENGDIIIGGSAHLLRFMERVGYTLPEGRVFVQPNVIELAHLDIEDKRSPVEPGDVVQCDELAFFGRIETRKGIEVFCEALDYLVARGTVPSKVSFLGKPGALLSHPDMNSLEYLEQRAAKWPFEVEIHTGFNQLQVISYLTAKNRIAVMPSLIENSTMAVYEALIYKVPFIASNSGGTPELVAPEHHDETLVPARPRELANGLERALRDGARVGRCSFDNTENLRVWNAVHKFLAARFETATAPQIIEEMRYAGGPHVVSAPRLSMCLLHRGPTEAAKIVIDSLVKKGEAPPDQIVLAVHEHGENTDAFAELKASVSAPEGVALDVISANERSLGEAYNLARQNATGDALVFARTDIHMPDPKAASTLRSAFTNSDASIFTCFYDTIDQNSEKPRHNICIGADMSSGFYDRKNMGSSMIAIRAELFDRRGGFTDIFGVDGVEHSFVFSAIHEGEKVEIIPEHLVVEQAEMDSLSLNQTSAQYLVARDLIQSPSYPLRRLLLVSDIDHIPLKPENDHMIYQLALSALPSRFRDIAALEDAFHKKERWGWILMQRPWAFEEWMAVRRLNRLTWQKNAKPNAETLALNALPDEISSIETIEKIIRSDTKWSDIWKKKPHKLTYVAAVRRLHKRQRNAAS